MDPEKFRMRARAWVKVDRNELWHNYRRRREVNGRLTSPPPPHPSS